MPDPIETRPYTKVLVPSAVYKLPSSFQCVNMALVMSSRLDMTRVQETPSMSLTQLVAIAPARMTDSTWGYSILNLGGVNFKTGPINILSSSTWPDRQTPPTMMGINSWQLNTSLCEAFQFRPKRGTLQPVLLNFPFCLADRGNSWWLLARLHDLLIFFESQESLDYGDMLSKRRQCLDLQIMSLILALKKVCEFSPFITC